MSYHTVIPISIIEKYLDDPGSMGHYDEIRSEYYMYDKDKDRIISDLRDILRKYHSCDYCKSNITNNDEHNNFRRCGGKDGDDYFDKPCEKIFCSSKCLKKHKKKAKHPYKDSDCESDSDSD